ncbi:MAG: hypothetical protein JW940_33710 [Polyangiaceae bacterium]|nr:hypothetical protein [Polyangiaceae bacterium]
MGPGVVSSEQAAHDDTARPAVSPPASRMRGRCNVLTLSLLSFFAIGFGCWLIYARSSYLEQYAQVTTSWHVGVPRMVELTLVKDDKAGLACASDQVIEGLHCGHRADLRPADPSSPDHAQVLQPYNTVKNELLLGSGLWGWPDLKQNLPPTRFSVVCTYLPLGVVKSVSVRFGPTARFNPVGNTVTAGTLTNCVLPR